MFLKNAWEIYTFANTQKVPLDTAILMFRANVMAGSAEGNPGGDLTDADYAALKIEWDAMTSEERSKASADCNKILWDNADKLSTAFHFGEAGDRQEFDKIIADAIAAAE